MTTYDLEGWKSIAEVLGVTPRTARAWMRAAGRRSPVLMYRRRVRARRAELVAWFESVHRPYA